MMPETRADHTTHIERHERRARCLCGWTGPEQDDTLDAIADAVEHEGTQCAICGTRIDIRRELCDDCAEENPHYLAFRAYEERLP